MSAENHAITTLVHAILKDVVLEPVLDTVVSLALQHAGADRAVLALSRGGALSIIAEGTRNEEVIRVQPRSGTVDTADHPGQVFREVLRTLEPASLEIEERTADVVAEPSGGRRPARTVLGLPLLRQAKLIGILYLEVGASGSPIPPPRMEMLKILAAQAAIALDNARRYWDIEGERAGLSRAEKALLTVEDGFRLLADAVPDVLWILDLKLEKVVYTSPSFERVWGLPVEELYKNSGLWAEMIHPEDHQRVWDRFRRWIAGEPVDYLDVGFRIVRPDGAIRWIHERGVLILDEGGRPRAVAGISSDLTELRKTEMELRRSEVYLAEAQRLSLTGSFGWRSDSGEMFWSDETYRIFDVDPATKPTVEIVLQRTHPDDRAQLQQTLERARRGAWDWNLQHRIMMPDGSMKHLHVVAHTMRSEEAGGTEYVGAVMDVTAASDSRRALEAAYRDIQYLKDRLQSENVILREELDKTSMFDEIVGRSDSLQRVLSCVSKVAPTESTVLITGETGTGKELIARAIHRHSRRSARIFVTVNCSAIPPTLVGSELFGHEKGAFTGAQQRRIGRFEQAEGGTIFLDEIGDLPAETQIALLRVLQEREFERIGGGRSIPVDVRVIAATNSELEAAVAQHEFRADLFYRLNVVPIAMPSLRDRRDDIPLLVEYFVERFSRKQGKHVREVSRKSMDLLLAYSWQGNVRELQNVIERAITLAESETLTIDARWLAQPTAHAGRPDERFAARRSAQERSMIETALAETLGRVSGRHGAAARLKMPASTLESKIRSLGIDKGRFHRA